MSQMRANRTRVVLRGCRTALVALVGLGGVGACGGDSKTPRPDELPAEVPPVDNGGKLANCDAEAAYDIEWVETWETGSGAWYTNNDICEPCNDLETDLDTWGRMQTCLSHANDAVNSESPDAGASVDPDDVDDVKAALANCPEDPGIDLKSETLRTDVSEKLSDLEATIADAQAEMKACRPPCEASQTPSFFLDVVPSTRIIGGHRCDSQYALNVDTVRLEQWGLTVGKQYSLGAPKDLTSFEGILFWARRGPKAPSDVKVALADPYTEERAVDENGKSFCVFDAPYDDPAEACDKFGKRVTLTEDWQLFVVPFKEMRQDGFGKVAPLLELDEVLGISFDTRPGDHDLWIDDVGFYRKQ